MLRLVRNKEQGLQVAQHFVGAPILCQLYETSVRTAPAGTGQRFSPYPSGKSFSGTACCHERAAGWYEKALRLDANDIEARHNLFQKGAGTPRLGRSHGETPWSWLYSLLAGHTDTQIRLEAPRKVWRHHWWRNCAPHRWKIRERFLERLSREISTPRRKPLSDRSLAQAGDEAGDCL